MHVTSLLVLLFFSIRVESVTLLWASDHWTGSSRCRNPVFFCKSGWLWDTAQKYSPVWLCKAQHKVQSFEKNSQRKWDCEMTLRAMFLFYLHAVSILSLQDLQPNGLLVHSRKRWIFQSQLRYHRHQRLTEMICLHDWSIEENIRLSIQISTFSPHLLISNNYCCLFKFRWENKHSGILNHSVSVHFIMKCCKL